LQKLTTTEVIDAEEEDDHPRLVAAVAATSLTDRAGEVEPAMSLYRERWMSSKWENGDLDLPVREPPLYTVAKIQAR
jgi:hypothetical protein